MSAQRTLWRLRPGQLLRRARRPSRAAPDRGRAAPDRDRAGADRGRAGRSVRGRGGRVSPRRRRLRPRTRLAIAALVAVLVVLAGGWLWFRDSSLVSVNQVSVTGASGPDAAQIRSALTAAGQKMTTLDVSVGQLRTAVAPYPVVGDIKVSSQFPHKLRIRVIERIPVGIVTVAGRATSVSADGMLLHDVGSGAALPTISTGELPSGSRVTDGTALQEIALLGAAPSQLIPRLSQVSSDATHGLTAQLRSGPAIYFGDAGRLAAKWIAVVQVLADPGSAGAAYIDVTDPDRPAAGAGSGASGVASTGSGASTGGAGTTSPTGAATTTGTGGGTGITPATGAGITPATGAATGSSSPTGG